MSETAGSPSGDRPVAPAAVAAHDAPSLADRLKSNLLVFAVGIAVLAGGTVAGISEYFKTEAIDGLKQSQQIEIEKADLKFTEKMEAANRQYETQIDALNSRITSVERRLGGQKYLDVQKFFVQQPSMDMGDASGQVQFNPEGEFFALQDATRWRYYKSTELALGSEVAGFDLAKVPAAAQRPFSLFPIYVWRGRQEYSVAGAFVKKLFPFIMVQIVPMDRAPELFGMLKSLSADFSDPAEVDVKGARSASNGNAGAKKEPGQEAKLNEYTKLLTGTFQSDAVGFFLTAQLSVLLNAASSAPNFTYSLRNVQKIGPLLYAQVIMKWSDVTVNGAAVDRLYLAREYFVISKSDRMIIIETNAVTQTPAFTGPAFNDITLWLGSFYLAQ
ncbi:MAG TPA: hypothetical protein VME92_06005 [Acetobacteraceae bacterium]|nr:hypothetical protein [Acetobacteraceae bacterium]